VRVRLGPGRRVEGEAAAGDGVLAAGDAARRVAGLARHAAVPLLAAHLHALPRHEEAETEKAQGLVPRKREGGGAGRMVGCLEEK